MEARRTARDTGELPFSRELARRAVPAHGSHVARFYESEHFLTIAVGDYVAEGLSSGQAAVVVATRPRLDGVAARLRADGVDVDRAARDGRLALVEARALLASFMDGPRPDPERFRAAVGDLVGRGLAAGGAAGLRAYGEMVDLLWREGNAEAAYQLEELWNELAHERPFALLCAYGLDGFPHAADAEHFAAVCGHHARVIPAESYAPADEAARLREVSALQQRARALEAELRRRHVLERELRAALAAQRAAEEVVRRSEEELKDTLENAAEGIHWVGPDGTILWANHAELAMLGYEREEYVGRDVREFHADADGIAEMLRRLACGETLREHPATLRRKDGSVRHVLINSNVLWRDGRFVHTRCFTRDVTALELAAAERERLLEAERAARAEAEAASRSKSQFLATMSHELRTPLNAIGGHVQLVELGIHGPVTDAQKEALARVARAQDHLLRLIDDVLDYARLESGRVEYDMRMVRVDEVVAEALALVEPQAAAKGLSIEALPSGSVEAPPLGWADRGRLRQVVLNLLANAVKFTPPGGRIVVDLAAPADGAAAEAVRVRVTDTGIGIGREAIDAVFEPFVQGERSYTRSASGAGLGLAISRELARGMGGDVTAESEVGRGSTFTVTLRRAGPPADAHRGAGAPLT